MGKHLSLSLALGIAVVSLAAQASADESVPVTKPSNTITLKTTTVVGSYRRPSVVIEVSRAKPEIKLADLQDPAVEKIVRAAAKAPFRGTTE